MWLDRNWVLPDTEPVGSIVTRVRAEDNEQDTLIYGLESNGHKYNGDDSPQPPLPFFIDNSTGTVFLNETLKGRVSIFDYRHSRNATKEWQGYQLIAYGIYRASAFRSVRE